MTYIGLKRSDADRSREKARQQALGKPRKQHGGSKPASTFPLDLTVKRCECGLKAWSDGQGGCHRCGKSLDCA